jgi:hypothetical protein
MRSLLFVCALVALPIAAQPVEPIPATFLPGGAAFDGCRLQWQTSGTVTAYSAPSAFSRALRTIDGMRRVDANDYSESLTAILQPGRVRATRPLTLDATRLDRGERAQILLGTGDELLVLGRASNGETYFTIAGLAYSGVVPGYGGGTGVETVERPVAEIWVRLVAHDETRPEAWLNTAQAGMVERERACD